MTVKELAEGIAGRMISIGMTASSNWGCYEDELREVTEEIYGTLREYTIVPGMPLEQDK